MSDKKEGLLRGFFRKLRKSLHVLRDEYVAGRDGDSEPEPGPPKAIAHEEVGEVPKINEELPPSS